MMVRELVPWHRQFRVLLSRAMKESARKTGVIYTQLAQAVIIAFLIGLVFYKVSQRVQWALLRADACVRVAARLAASSPSGCERASPGGPLLELWQLQKLF